MSRASLFLLVALSPIVASAQPTDPPTEPTPPVPPTAPVVEPVPAKQEPPKDEPKKVEAKKADHKDTPWYEKLAFRGYLQTRFNRLYDSTEADEYRNDLGDKNIVKNNSFSIRRARLVLSGDVAPFLAIYFQVEASGADVKMRDWYGDIYLDKDKEFRIRPGQSKVPFGFENLQSSQNRAPLDRSDPINSAAPGERDLGVFGYWAPKHVRKVFKHLVDSGLKGSGDYGVVGIGIYNGQTVNVDDKNENRHVVVRATYPFEIGKQILEVGGGGYVGKFTPEKDMTVFGRNNLRDARVGAAVIVYPQPIGFQAEYNVGRGPQLVGDTIESRDVHGGYAMVIGHVGDFYPFVRGAIYDGGLKTVKNAPLHKSQELIVGTEWHFHRRVELTVEMDRAKREVGSDSFTGMIFRTQLQLNY